MKSIFVPIEVSARHIHLSENDCRTLFGHGLTPLKPISQTGQYAARETLMLQVQSSKFKVQSQGVAVRRVIRNVRVVGPVRQESQVELALSDCRMLGLKNVPLKISGSLVGTPGITLVGPRGKVVLKRGVIIARRHIHCPTKKAKLLGLKNGQEVKVKVKGERGVIFEKVVVRVREDFVWKMHIDTDEANAAGISSSVRGVVLIKS